MNIFKVYEPRQFEFRSIAVLADWTIKIYTITIDDKFKSISVLNYAINNLPKWLENARKIDFENYGIAFLIIHEGRDGIWILLNWWIGENMLQSITFYTNYENRDEFKQMFSTGGMACVWELEVINFERKMWIEHILKKADRPDFTGYLEQKLNGEF